MTVKEFLERVKEIGEELKEDYWFVGVRFEEKVRNEGDVVTDKSRNNIDREDENDFPKYGTDEYFEMEELDGVSTWNIDQIDDTLYVNNDKFLNCDAKTAFLASKCYILASDDADSGLNTVIDHGEVILIDPVVKKVMF